MIDQLKKFIESDKLFNARDPILLAVSGGVDSVVMCELFIKSGFKFGIAHCNFELRDSESDKDAQFVEKLAARYKVQYWEESFDTENHAKEHDQTIQVAARFLRYAWLEKIRKKEGFHHIATAHHKNDVLETIIMNLTKGTGIAGMHGIASKTDLEFENTVKVIRPLLFATKEEIVTYAKKNNLKFREDKSNASDKYTRNKIRNKIVPLLKEINPDIENTFADNTRHFKQVEKVYRAMIDRFKQGLEEYNRKISKEETGKGRFLIPISKLLAFPSPEAALFEVLRQYKFNSKQVEQIFAALGSKSGKQFDSPTHSVYKDRGQLIVVEAQAKSIGEITIEEHEKQIRVDNRKISLETINVPEEKELILPNDASAEKINPTDKKLVLDTTKDIAWIDYSKLSFPLHVRTWKRGDYFYPLGLYKGSNGRKSNSAAPGKKISKKKLSRFFIDQKLSQPEKIQTPILLSGKKVVWVMGYRLDDRFKVTNRTKKVLKIQLK